MSEGPWFKFYSLEALFLDKFVPEISHYMSFQNIEKYFGIVRIEKSIFRFRFLRKKIVNVDEPA